MPPPFSGSGARRVQRTAPSGAGSPDATPSEKRENAPPYVRRGTPGTRASPARAADDCRKRRRERYSGTVEKFIGDAVMAVFGAPVAHEDDAERAVRAGLRILEAIEELNEPRRQALASGADRDQHRRGRGRARRPPRAGEGIVTGDVVNTASRLQGAAPLNGIAVSEQTYRATERIFDYEELEPVLGEGEGGAARALAPARRTRPLRHPMSPARTTTPLVGRELEKPLLIGTFERSAQQRSCQLVTIVGEPGVGKSRLCAEFFEYIDERAGFVALATGPLPALRRGDRLLGARGDRQGRVRASSSPTPRMRRRQARPRAPAGRARPAWLKARLAPLVGGRWRARLPGRVVHRLAALPGVARRPRARGARLRGSALGRRGPALLPRAPGRLDRGRAPARALHRPSGVVRTHPGFGANARTRTGSTSRRSRTRRPRA